MTNLIEFSASPTTEIFATDFENLIFCSNKTQSGLVKLHPQKKFI